MALPVVAIIGRPNVGKSSLLNALAGEMISIVEPTGSVTRDCVSTIIGVANKADTSKLFPAAGEFSKLSFGVSAYNQA